MHSDSIKELTLKFLQCSQKYIEVNYLMPAVHVTLDFELLFLVNDVIFFKFLRQLLSLTFRVVAVYRCLLLLLMWNNWKKKKMNYVLACDFKVSWVLKNLSFDFLYSSPWTVVIISLIISFFLFSPRPLFLPCDFSREVALIEYLKKPQIEFRLRASS